MSLWWTRRNNLDDTQLSLIEELPLGESHLILGPPGSGKTNVLLRRAQFVRTQQMPNVMVLTFTRSLTEFVKTGCFDDQKREIFPRSCVSTIESWLRNIYWQHQKALPSGDMVERKALLAKGAIELASAGKLPRYDALFVDEAQDLMDEEIECLYAWSPTVFFVGDDRQRIYEHSKGLTTLRALPVPPKEHVLPFHYRLAPELCEVADRILQTESGSSLRKASHYKGPAPGRIDLHRENTKSDQIALAAASLKDQLRAYAGLIEQGDLLGVIVPRTDDRELVFNAFELDPVLAGKSQVIRARTGDSDDRDFDISISAECPIAIVSEQGCKGLEFRAVHWLFANDLAEKRNAEKYYTVVTRAKTSLDIYYSKDLPQTLAKACSPPASDLWSA